MSIKKKLMHIMEPVAWKFITSYLRLLVKVSPYFGNRFFGERLKKMADLDPEGKTQGYTLNLNSNLAEAAEGVVLPVDMMKALVRESEHIAVMKKCLCRSAFSCKNYPHDHACIFTNKGALSIIKSGAGRRITVEEALAHIDKGAELGLIGQALWVEIERAILGLKREVGVAHWIEICFCCPCCCGTFKLNKATTDMTVKTRFRSIGWKAAVDDQACNQCLRCVQKCPINAISQTDGRITINNEACLGCGLCAANCPQDAIQLKLEGPVHEDIRDYFIEGGLKVDF